VTELGSLSHPSALSAEVPFRTPRVQLAPPIVGMFELWKLTTLPDPLLEQVAQHDDDGYFGHPYFRFARQVSAATIRRAGRFSPPGVAVNTDELANLRLLDIGLHTGAFLQAAAREFGTIPVGIDVGRAAVGSDDPRH